MDPNKCLEDIRFFLAHILEDNEPVTELDIVDLAGAIYALDEWLSRGGFLPAAWGKGRDR